MSDTVYLWLLTSGLNDWDTHDSCVVAETSEERARLVHPDGSSKWTGETWDPAGFYGWLDPSRITVKKIGVAIGCRPGKLICASTVAG